MHKKTGKGALTLLYLQKYLINYCFKTILPTHISESNTNLIK